MWAAAFALTGLDVWYSLAPPPPAIHELSLSDKLLHFGAYAATTSAFLVAAVWRPGRGDGRFPRSAVWIFALASGLALAMEAAQAAFTAREPELLDALAGFLGAGAAGAVWMLFRLSGNDDDVG